MAVPSSPLSSIMALTPIINRHSVVTRRKRRESATNIRSVRLQRNRRQSIAAMQSNGPLVPPTPCKASHSVCKSGFVGKRAQRKVARSSITPSPKRPRRVWSGASRSSSAKGKLRPASSRPLQASFVNLGLVGVGSFCEVFKVQHRESQQLFAIKRSTKKLNTEEAVNCVLNEVEIMRTLQCQQCQQQPAADEAKDAEESTHHPHIARFVDFWISYSRQLHQVYELYPHGTLLDLVEHQTAQLNRRQVLQCLEQLCRALAFVHSVDIVHLDLKPCNVFVSARHELKLGDFGISIDLKKAKTKKAKMAYSGDPIYIAPELMNFERSLSDDVCARTDIFSLGILLLELLCDIKAPSQGPIFQALRSDDVDFDAFEPEPEEQPAEQPAEHAEQHAELHAQLKLLCRDMLRRESSERPTATQLLRRIERIKASHAELERMPPLSSLELPPSSVSAQEPDTEQLAQRGCASITASARKPGASKDVEVFVQESPKTYAALFTYPSPPPSSPFSSPFSAVSATECQLDLNVAFENARSPFASPAPSEHEHESDDVERSPFCKLLRVTADDARHRRFLPFGDFGERDTDDSDRKSEDESDFDEDAMPKRLTFGFV